MQFLLYVYILQVCRLVCAIMYVSGYLSKNVKNIYNEKETTFSNIYLALNSVILPLGFKILTPAVYFKVFSQV